MAALERPIRLHIVGQAERFLLNLQEDEFHYVRGLLLLLGSNYEVDGQTVTTIDRPPLVFRVYRDREYVVTFNMAGEDYLVVASIQRA